MGLDAGRRLARRFGPGAGLVAATRRYDAPPVWLVTGATARGVRAAAGLLDAPDLRDRYAVATEAGRRDAASAGGGMRSPFAYTPRSGPLQAASPGAAVAYLGALVAVAFLYSSPLVLAAAGAGAALAGRLRRAPAALCAWRCA